jgi:hypothetical protein
VLLLTILYKEKRKVCVDEVWVVRCRSVVPYVGVHRWGWIDRETFFIRLLCAVPNFTLFYWLLGVTG